MSSKICLRLRFNNQRSLRLFLSVLPSLLIFLLSCLDFSFFSFFWSAVFFITDVLLLIVILIFLLLLNIFFVFLIAITVIWNKFLLDFLTIFLTISHIWDLSNYRLRTGPTWQQVLSIRKTEFLQPAVAAAVQLGPAGDEGLGRLHLLPSSQELGADQVNVQGVQVGLPLDVGLRSVGDLEQRQVDVDTQQAMSMSTKVRHILQKQKLKQPYTT